MSTFVPSGQAETTPAPSLQNLPQYPEISPEAFRATMNVDDTVQNEWIEASLKLSMFDVNADLATWWADQADLGYSAIQDTTAEAYGTENRNKALYIMAVQHLAKARVLEKMRNFDSTAEGIRKADDMTPAIGDHQRESRRAVRLIMGETGTVVELI